jgi:glycosyltransferase involved in cell wall biosynthesis
MRILMLLGRSTGGIGTHVDDLAEALRDQGHTVDLASDRLTASTFGWSQAHQVWPDGRGGLPASLLSVRRLAHDVDVVHAHGHQAGALGALAVRSLPRGRRPALVVSLHNAVLGGSARRASGAISAQPFTRTAQLVTGASSDLVEQAVRWGASWAELAEVPSPRVPGLLATSPLTRAERRSEARRLLLGTGIEPAAGDLVLTIARIAPQKDLDTLVAAAAADAAARPATKRTWVVVGGGETALAEELRRQVQRTGAPLTFVGAQSDPTPWLRAASVFVLTSHWEARALVVQEAMAAGVPVIARRTGGLLDLVDGVGTLVRGSVPAEWADALDLMLSDDHAWSRAAAAGRERAAGWDDGDRTASRWVSRYVRARAMT